MVSTQTVQAARGDTVEVSGRRVGDSGRKGEILDVLGAAGHPHYLVRWEDGHESVLYPGEGTTIHAHAGRVQPTPALDLAAATADLAETLRDAGVDFELLPHRRTSTALAEAHVLGVLEQTVAKTVIARAADGRIVRAVLPASARLDLEKLARGEPVALLTETELLSTYPQFELGAVPPFGGPAGDRVVVDRGLAEREHVVLEAGVHDTSLRLRTGDLVEVAGAEVADIAAG